MRSMPSPPPRFRPFFPFPSARNDGGLLPCRCGVWRAISSRWKHWRERKSSPNDDDDGDGGGGDDGDGRKKNEDDAKDRADDDADEEKKRKKKTTTSMTIGNENGAILLSAVGFDLFRVLRHLEVVCDDQRGRHRLHFVAWDERQKKKKKDDGGDGDDGDDGDDDYDDGVSKSGDESGKSFSCPCAAHRPHRLRGGPSPLSFDGGVGGGVWCPLFLVVFAFFSSSSPFLGSLFVFLATRADDGRKKNVRNARGGANR